MSLQLRANSRLLPQSRPKLSNEPENLPGNGKASERWGAIAMQVGFIHYISAVFIVRVVAMAVSGAERPGTGPRAAEFRVSSELVVLPLSIIDHTGHTVLGFGAGDFIVAGHKPTVSNLGRMERYQRLSRKTGLGMELADPALILPTQIVRAADSQPSDPHTRLQRGLTYWRESSLSTTRFSGMPSAERVEEATARRQGIPRMLAPSIVLLQTSAPLFGCGVMASG